MICLPSVLRPSYLAFDFLYPALFIYTFICSISYMMFCLDKLVSIYVYLHFPYFLVGYKYPVYGPATFSELQRYYVFRRTCMYE